MVEQVLLLLQVLFLVLLYLFVWRVVRSAARDLRVAPQESFVLSPGQAAQAGLGAQAAGPPGRLIVVASTAVPPGTAHEVGPVPLTIGRSADNDLALPGDDFASSRHARVEAGKDGAWILDLGSTNGTYVNGERVNGRRHLHPGDLVQIGDTELRYDR